MNWETLSTTVLPLLGVLLGTGGTLLGQHLATRVDRRRLEHDQLVAMRAERKAAILSFLDAAQRVEMVLDERTESKKSPSEAGVQEGIHQLWLAKKSVELVCSPELAQNAHDYTYALHASLKSPDLVTDPRAKRQARHLVMESARQDLGITGRPLQRELSPVSTTGDD
ncbi:hypothetical protein AB0B56_26380 [Streptosporangium canum]|uniref:hypothetical protein n=1 Tax=Streptosporangium canum TaxID=324952 RepID=UPI00344318FC